jgi:hypothetical protein
MEQDPLDQALHDFELAAGHLPKVGRMHLLSGLDKLVSVVRELRAEKL